MTDDLARSHDHAPVYRTVSAESRARINDALDDAIAPSTRRAYIRHWKNFENYCQACGYNPLPADVDVVCEYLTMLETTATPQRHPDRQGLSPSAINQTLAAIKFVHHKLLAVPEATAASPVPIPLWTHPQLDTMMQAIRRRAVRNGRRPSPKRPLLLDELTTILQETEATADTWRRRLYARRDCAALLLGWAGGMRRSEVVALRACDVTRRYGKWTATVSRSKTDQLGVGTIKALPVGQHVVTCAPCAVVRWMECITVFDAQGRVGLIRLLSGGANRAGHVCDRQPAWAASSDPLFRRISRSCAIGGEGISDATIYDILERRVAASSLDIDVADIGAHSLRAGLVTEAVLQGINARAIQRQTGHKSVEALMGYAREHDVFDNNAVTDIGL